MERVSSVMMKRATVPAYQGVIFDENEWEVRFDRDEANFPLAFEDYFLSGAMVLVFVLSFHPISDVEFGLQSYALRSGGVRIPASFVLLPRLHWPYPFVRFSICSLVPHPHLAMHVPEKEVTHS